MSDCVRSEWRSESFPGSHFLWSKALFIHINIAMNDSPIVSLRRASVNTEPVMYPTSQCIVWSEESCIKNNDAFYDQIKASIKENGIEKPLMGLWDNKAIRVIQGNTRLMIARELNIKELPVVIIPHVDDYEWFRERVA